ALPTSRSAAPRRPHAPVRRPRLGPRPTCAPRGSPPAGHRRRPGCGDWTSTCRPGRGSRSWVPPAAASPPCWPPSPACWTRWRDAELDGEDLAALDPAEIRAGVTMFAEDAHVFATTVRENLKVVRGDLDDAQIRAALTAVGLSDWVDELPHGLDTMLGPDGTTVSGGERRRLLLARAVVRGGPVLLLDEPTEHLDTARGDALLGALLDPQDTSLVPASSTVVVVTHRIEAIPTGTSILRLEDHR